MRRTLFVLLLSLLLAPLVLADTIYLRDGRTLTGTVLGFINGRIVVKTGPPSAAGAQTTQQAGASESGEIRFLRPAEVERIEIDGRSLDEARFVTNTVQVALGPNWIDSGVDLRRGQRVQVRASGTIYAGRSRITPDGLRSTDPSAPLPRAAEGVLIGAVGNDPDSPIVELGLSREFTADRDGRLYLTVNRGSYTDARGFFNAQIRTERELPQRRTDTAGGRSEQEETSDPFGMERRTTPAPVRPRNPSERAAGEPYSRARREVTIEVAGTSRGTDTGIDLRAGDRVTITATGKVVAGRRAGEVGPEGGAATGVGALFGTRPVPEAGVGALIGYIRLTNGQAVAPFFVGSQQTITAQADGRLILLINDDNYADNGGSFNVRLVVD